MIFHLEHNWMFLSKPILHNETFYSVEQNATSHIQTNPSDATLLITHHHIFFLIGIPENPDLCAVGILADGASRPNKFLILPNCVTVRTERKGEDHAWRIHSGRWFLMIFGDLSGRKMISRGFLLSLLLCGVTSPKDEAAKRCKNWRDEWWAEQGRLVKHWNTRWNRHYFIWPWYIYILDRHQSLYFL